MPAFPSTIPPSVSILVPGAPYNSYGAIVNALNSTSYKITQLYIQSPNLAQQITPMQIYHYKPTGPVDIFYLTPLPSIYMLQSIGVINIDTKKLQIILDSNTYLNYVVQPLTTVTLILYYAYLDLADLLTV